MAVWEFCRKPLQKHLVWAAALKALCNGRFSHSVVTLVALAAVIAGTERIGFAQGNPGDPLFCQPNEGNAFLIVNGGGGIFTVDPDCYNNNINNDTTTTITTSQGGTLTLTRAANGGNYTYTPPTPTFTGLDTFSINVTTVWNSAGGVGSAGGVARPGGPATINVILNVIPATVTLAAPGTATTLAIPAGSITGCGAQGNAGQGPPPGAISGCITQIQQGFGGVNPSHGAVARGGAGNNTLIYTPNVGYTGPDTFTYQAFGINTDGTNALSSGNVTVNVTVTAPVVPNTPVPSTLWLVCLGLGLVTIWMSRKRYRIWHT